MLHVLTLGRGETETECRQLPALSGLARFYADRPTTRLAGLWKKSLPYQLFWMRNNFFNRDTTRKSRPRTYRAPSWSWLLLVETCRVLKVYTSKRGWRSTHCSLFAHEIELKGSNQFGQVTGGWVKLKAIQGRVRIAPHPVPNAPYDALYNWVNRVLIGRCWLDMVAQRHMILKMFGISGFEEKWA